MDTSILIARIVAVTYLASGVALLNGNLSLMKTYSEMKHSQMFTAIMGSFTTLLGMLIVSFHNVWVADWTVLITVIGWTLLVEGIFYLAFPKTLLSLYKKLPQSQTGWGLFTIAFGLLFAYFGFAS